MLGMFAEFERSLIIDRIRRGKVPTEDELAHLCSHLRYAAAVR